MALHDRFNRPGDHWLTRCDYYLTAQADRLGAWWTLHTPWHRLALTQGLLALGACAALERVAVLHDSWYIFVAYAALQSFAQTILPRFGGLLEEMQFEASGLPRWTASAVNLLMLYVGLFGLACALGWLLVAAVYGVAPPPLPLLDSLLGGLAFSAWKWGEYLARTNPVGPNGTPRRSDSRA
ncbi:MAG TPA: hypothetical protein VFW96_29545 [Thermomicrobiales bacterium]|nr:hypothetical protein [Thermomicrobiales bacterium]